MDDIITSPLARQRYIKAKANVLIPFSRQEIDVVRDPLSEFLDFDGQRDRLLFAHFYSTRMKRSELINLKIGDIN